MAGGYDVRVVTEGGGGLVVRMGGGEGDRGVTGDSGAWGWHYTKGVQLAAMLRGLDMEARLKIWLRCPKRPPPDAVMLRVHLESAGALHCFGVQKWVRGGGYGWVNLRVSEPLGRVWLAGMMLV